MKILKQKSFTTISLLALFAFCLALVIIRWINIFNEDVYVLTQTINFHITNFILSFMVCTIAGYVLLVTGKKYIFCGIVALLLAVANLVYEVFLPMLNTTDIVDAYYGWVGVAISLVYLYIISKFGFVRQ